MHNCSSYVFILVVLHVAIRVRVLLGGLRPDQGACASLARSQHVVLEVLQDLLVLATDEVLLVGHSMWVELRVSAVGSEIRLSSTAFSLAV